MKCTDCYDRGTCDIKESGCHEGVIGRTPTGLPIYRNLDEPWTEEQHKDYEWRLLEAENTAEEKLRETTALATMLAEAGRVLAVVAETLGYYSNAPECRDVVPNKAKRAVEMWDAALAAAREAGIACASPPPGAGGPQVPLASRQAQAGGGQASEVET